jgi:uncharacterized 2Fe-2S/4Fe-4S cluster protein (DUF4445 family)
MDTIRIRLEPLGTSIEAPRGAPLRELLFAQGVEFPCGGAGRCRGCRVRLLQGHTSPNEEDSHAFSAADLAAGWRLACHLRPDTDVTLEIAQWMTPVLSDDTAFTFMPREGLGVAVDVGTTTLVAQSVDLETGRLLGTGTALNPQAAHGSDVMSRVERASGGRDGGLLTSLIRSRVGEMVSELAGGGDLREVALVGNTVMHHLFCGLDVEPLSHVPFSSRRGGEVVYEGGTLEWLPAGARLRFLPCLGGFVGSDILAGALATHLHRSVGLQCLVDLGTNGEIVIGNRERMLCASTAAGPAFEGARISMGMRAANGAIAHVSHGPEGLLCHVLVGGPARGVCGSGLVDAVAVGLELGLIAPGGRLAGGPWTLMAPVTIQQSDIRELQLAKAAIAAGVRILLRRGNWNAADVERVHLAGAFGNYVRPESACRIGLLPFAEDRVSPAGNTALLGAKMALFENPEDLDALEARIEHVPLAEDPEFQEDFIKEMEFPASEG